MHFFTDQINFRRPSFVSRIFHYGKEIVLIECKLLLFFQLSQNDERDWTSLPANNNNNMEKKNAAKSFHLPDQFKSSLSALNLKFSFAVNKVVVSFPKL